jgi:uncharacterized damage-inducible protein DinB
MSSSSRAVIELLRGKGAHADPVACVEDLAPELAARHVEGFPHSIAELVFHMNYWMDYELRRVRGEKPPHPDHNSASFPSPGAAFSSEDWNSLRTSFARLLADFAELAKSSEENMQRQVESLHERDKQIASTLEASLWQVVVHNSYHVGQVVMLRQALNAWPPRGGVASLW